MAERRTPARQSDDTHCSRVLASLDLAQWRWVCGGGEDSRVWVSPRLFAVSRGYWVTGESSTW